MYIISNDYSKKRGVLGKFIFFLTAILVAGLLQPFNVYGQVNATPNVISGCSGTQVQYTFSYTGGGSVISNPTWDIIPASAGSLTGSNEGMSVTVVWNGTGNVRVSYPEMVNGEVTVRSDLKSFSVTASPASGGIMGGASSVCSGGSGTVTISGASGALTWQRCTSGCSSNSDAGWSTVPSGSFSNLTVPTSFRIKAESSCNGIVYSNSRTVQVAAYVSPTVTINNPFPVCGNNTGGQTFTATETLQNYNPTFSWYKNGSPVDDNEVTGDPKTYRPHYILQSQDVIRCDVSYAYQCMTQNPVPSNLVTVSLTPPTNPSVSITAPSTLTLCEGDPITFGASSPQAITSYAWRIGNGSGESPIFSTESSYRITAGQELRPGDYIKLTVGVSGTCLSTSTAEHDTRSITISVNPKVNTGILLAGASTICNNGQTIRYTATPSANAGQSPAIAWYKNTTHLRSGPGTTYDFSTSELNATDVIKVVMHPNVACPAPLTASSQIQISSVTQAQTPSVIISNPFPVCGTNLNQVAFISTLMNGGANPTYTWFRGSSADQNLQDNESTDQTIYRPRYLLAGDDKIKCRVTYTSGCLTSYVAESNVVPVSVTQPVQPQVDLSAPDLSLCQGESITFSASSPSSLYSITRYEWRIGGSPVMATTPSYTLVAGDDFREIDPINVTITVSGECLQGTTASASTSNLSVSIKPVPAITINPDGQLENCAGKTNDFSLTIADNAELGPYQWDLSPPSAGTISPTGRAKWADGYSGAVTVIANATVCTNLHRSDVTSVLVHPRPPTPSQLTLQYCDFESISLADKNWPYAFNWYDNANTLLRTGYEFEIPSKPEGNYSYRAEYINEFGCISVSKFPINVAVTSSCDEQLNYIEAISRDADQSEIGHSKTYFDKSGKLLQAQTKSYERPSIFAVQSLEDRYGRSVISTLPAPTLKTGFQYMHRFVRNTASTDLYKITDFDSPATLYNPNEVGDDLPGTLGWYYSENNTIEDHVPTTDYPYSRTEFYEDGTGEVKRNGSPGDMHRLGKGHEPLSGTFPVYKELDNYLIKRRDTQVGLPDKQTDGTFKNEAVQSVVRDANGSYAVSIADKSGKGVMSARKGSASDFTLKVKNNVASNLVIGSPDYRPLTYFYILNDQAITIADTDASYTIEDIISGTAYTPQGNTWLAGFYRIILTSGSIRFNYTNHYLDVSYQFYDDAGRLKYSVSPNGYKNWTAPTDSTAFKDIDKTTYQYNHQGWLLSMTEPDAGRTEYAYSKDGKIRFSQNAQQKKDKTFSYTNYDDLGRPEESGQYTLNGSETFASLKTTSRLESIGAAWMSAWVGTKKHWVKTHYDIADPNFYGATSLSSATYTQNFVRSAVAWSENENIRTWYSYDDQGRVTWMAQKPTNLSRVFVIKYDYDFLGNVKATSSLAYMGGQVAEQNYHHYEYDKDKRLSKAYTSVNGTDKKLRAVYKYYLHGPLKRIELGDKLQGIDFVYNINGWLTKINHPNAAQDPGNDGAGNGFREDAFGMSLDYYESEMTGLFPVTVNPIEINDPLRIHHLPKLEEPAIKESLAGTNGQQMKTLLESMKQLRSEARVGNIETTEN